MAMYSMKSNGAAKMPKKKSASSAPSGKGKTVYPSKGVGPGIKRVVKTAPKMKKMGSR